MAALNGVNYAKEFVNVPSEQADPGTQNGKVKVLLDWKAGAVDTDTINIGKLPKGARVIRCSHIGGGGVGVAYNVAPGDVMADETLVIFTVGAAPGATPTAFIEYILD